MRIPPSVFVMSVVVAVPFGLAIKQTVKHEDPAGQLQREEEEMAATAAREQAEYEKREADEKARAALEKKQRDEKLMGLFGDKPATMGPELKGFELGSVPVPGQIEDLQASALGIEVERQPTGQMYAISARLGPEFYTDDGATGCSVVRARLETTWGPGKGGIWLDPATHMRVSIQDSRCEIRFDRYLEVADWLKQLPFDYVGKKASDVKELDYTTGDTTWHLPGVEAGDSATEVSITTSEKGRVTGLTITTRLPWELRETVLAALTKKYGKPAVDLDDPEVYTWKRQQVTLSYVSTRVDIVVGKLAEDRVIHTIVAGADLSQPSELAVHRAAAIAQLHGAKLVLVSAHADDAPIEHVDNDMLQQLGEVSAAMRDETAKRLATLVDAVKQRGVDVELASPTGPPGEVIAQLAKERGAELIVVGTHGHTGISRFLLGSVATSVIRHAPCDVLVVRGTTAAAPFERPLVAIDFSPASFRALRNAAQLTRPGATIEIVHAWQLPVGSVGASLFGQARFPWSTIRDAVLKNAQAQADKLVAAHAMLGFSLHVDLIQGPPASVITHAAERGQHDLISIGTHGHRGFRRLLLGSVAEGVIRHAPCSVLVAHGEHAGETAKFTKA